MPNERTVTLFSTLRQASTRCKNKLVRKLRMGYALADVFAWKWGMLVRHGNFADSMVAIHEDDVELLEKFGGFRVANRTRESTQGAPPLNVIFDPLRHSSCTHAMWVNPCLMFVPIRVYLDALKAFETLVPQSATSVVMNRGWFFDEEGRLLNRPNHSVVSTQHMKPILECFHAFHIFNIDRMLRTGSYWSGEARDPAPFVVDANARMLMDVDTEFDFELLDAYVYTRKIDFEEMKGILSEGL